MEDNGNGYKVSMEHRITKVEERLGGIGSQVNTIMTNHLPHIEAAVDGLKDAFNKKMYSVMGFLIVTLVGVLIDLGIRLFGN